MKLNKLALLAAIISVGPASASDGRDDYFPSLATHSSEVAPVSYCDCGEAVCGCDSVATDPNCGSELRFGIGPQSDPACGWESVPAEPACGWEPTRVEPGCGWEPNRNGTGGLGMGLDPFARRDLGDPWTLFGECNGYSIGGWTQFGYHSKSLPAFNNRPDEFQLHQAWVYAEKALDTSRGFGVGGRIDYIYGTDGPNTQAFGTSPRGWDNKFDNSDDSGYGHAIPQAYFEAGYGDLSVKLGHFYTTIGYEVVPATGNFFYSHAYTFNFSEPFTHTGALATYQVTEDVKTYGGYVLGWDSAFDDNGDAYLSGVSAQLTEDLNVTYSSIVGRFGEGRFNGVEKGYMHSVVADLAITEKLQYVFQTDVLSTEDVAGATARDTFDINQYLFYTLSDRLSVGGRFEWWQVQGDSAGFATAPPPANFDPTAEDFDFYALTLGLNYKPHANVVIRPEIRWDWIDGRTDVLAVTGAPSLENGSDEQTTFGIDTTFLF